MPSISDDRADRIEDKLDRLTEAVTKLVLIDERQIRQGERIGKLEEMHSEEVLARVTLEKKVDMWINRGIGIWLFASSLVGLWQVFKG